MKHFVLTQKKKKNALLSDHVFIKCNHLGLALLLALSSLSINYYPEVGGTPDVY